MWYGQFWTVREDSTEIVLYNFYQIERNKLVGNVEHDFFLRKENDKYFSRKELKQDRKEGTNWRKKEIFSCACPAWLFQLRAGLTQANAGSIVKSEWHTG